MKILKSVLQVYIGIAIIFAIGLFICAPAILAEYFNNEFFYWLFLINIPIFLGLIIHYVEPIGGNTRPRR